MLTGLMSGCSSKEKPFLGVGIDKIPKSKCANCKRKTPFYQNGKWFNEDKK